MGTGSHKWRSHGELSGGKGGGGKRMRGKAQGIRIINGRYKIDRVRLRIVQEVENPKNLYV